MPIPVTCPSCLTRFSVSDKYAGKSGPCPKCKNSIQIPELTDQVVIHAPVDSSPKDSKGKSVLKPIRREEIKLSLPVLIASILVSLVIFGIALGFGLSKTPPHAAILGIAAPLLAFPLVSAGYWFLHDDELQGYSGRELWIRSAICSAIFGILWGLYSFLPAFVGGYSTLADVSTVEMLVTISIMIGIGTLAGVLSLELEAIQGLLLYMLYFVITFVLVWLSGTPLGEILPGNSQTPTNRPTPQHVAPESHEPPPQSPQPQIPNMLQ